MKIWYVLVVSIACAFSVQAADSSRVLLTPFPVPDRGLLLVRWSEVESNSVRVSISIRHTRKGVLQGTNYMVSFRYVDMPGPVARKIYGLHRNERVQIKGRDGLTSVAGRLRSVFPLEKESTGLKTEKCTLQMQFDTEEEAKIAADYLAGRTRRPRDS